MKFPESVPVKGFPNYEALSDGNIRNRKTGRLVKPQISSDGFKSMTLRRDKKQYSVRTARIIADSFYEEDIRGLDVGYRDGDKQNTAPDNLLICTRSETMLRVFESGRREFATRVKVKIVETGEVFRSIRACAIALGEENYRFSIANCLDDPNRTFKGYHFVEYISQY